MKVNIKGIETAARVIQHLQLNQKDRRGTDYFSTLSRPRRRLAREDGNLYD